MARLLDVLCTGRVNILDKLIYTMIATGQWSVAKTHLREPVIPDSWSTDGNHSERVTAGPIQQYRSSPESRYERCGDARNQ